MMKFTIMFLFIQQMNIVVVFNAKGKDFQFENAGNLELLVTNSHLADKDTVGGVSASVFKVL